MGALVVLALAGCDRSGDRSATPAPASRAAPAADARAAEGPKHVVFIISDDQAWGDYSFMGHDAIRTPNLDRLASQSLVYTRGYVPTSTCRPSLASIVTGLYPHQHGITGNARALSRTRHHVARCWQQALNSRAQNRHMPWPRFRKLLEVYPLPPRRMVASVYRRRSETVV